MLARDPAVMSDGYRQLSGRLSDLLFCPKDKSVRHCGEDIVLQIDGHALYAFTRHASDVRAALEYLKCIV